MTNINGLTKPQTVALIQRLAKKAGVQYESLFKPAEVQLKRKHIKRITKALMTDGQVTVVTERTARRTWKLIIVSPERVKIKAKNPTPSTEGLKKYKANQVKEQAKEA